MLSTQRMLLQLHALMYSSKLPLAREIPLLENTHGEDYFVYRTTNSSAKDQLAFEILNYLGICPTEENEDTDCWKLKIPAKLFFEAKRRGLLEQGYLPEYSIFHAVATAVLYPLIDEPEKFQIAFTQLFGLETEHARPTINGEIALVFFQKVRNGTITSGDSTVAYKISQWSAEVFRGQLMAYMYGKPEYNELRAREYDLEKPIILHEYLELISHFLKRSIIGSIKDPSGKMLSYTFGLQWGKNAPPIEIFRKDDLLFVAKLCETHSEALGLRFFASPPWAKQDLRYLISISPVQLFEDKKAAENEGEAAKQSKKINYDAFGDAKRGGDERKDAAPPSLVVAPAHSFHHAPLSAAAVSVESLVPVALRRVRSWA